MPILIQPCTYINNRPAIAITDTFGGQTLMQGTTYPINWTVSNVATVSSEIDLLQNGRSVLVIAQNLPGATGSYNWRVPNNLVGSGYAIYIMDFAANTSKYTNSFSIAAPAGTQTATVTVNVVNLPAGARDGAYVSVNNQNGPPAYSGPVRLNVGDLFTVLGSLAVQGYTPTNSGECGLYATPGAVANHNYICTVTYAPTPIPCTIFHYNAYGDCTSDKTQTRTVSSSEPTGCAGGKPVLTQKCTYTAPTLTVTKVSAPAMATVSVKVNTAAPVGYTSKMNLAVGDNFTINIDEAIGYTFTTKGDCGGIATGALLAHKYLCTVTYKKIPTCTFKYSPWSPAPCPTSKTQTRVVMSHSPEGCFGGTQTALSQSCVYSTPVNVITSITGALSVTSGVRGRWDVNISTTAYGSPNFYVSDWGDGTADKALSTSPDFFHTYSAPGIYTATFVSTINGHVATQSITITVSGSGAASVNALQNNTAALSQELNAVRQVFQNLFGR
jgi:hypothetical protein